MNGAKKQNGVLGEVVRFGWPYSVSHVTVSLKATGESFFAPPRTT